MRRPWIEATALLAAHGHAVPTGPRNPHPEIAMSPDLCFALWPELKPGVRPTAFAGLDALARRIHRDRGQAGLELQDASLPARTGDEPVSGVSIWRQEPDGRRGAFIGFAHLDGGNRDRLQLALERIQPPGVFDTADGLEAA